MRRRSFVACLGVLAGGCVESPGSGGGRSPDPTATDAEPDGDGDSDSGDGVASGNGDSGTHTGSGAPGGTAGEFELADLTVSTTANGPDARYVLEPSEFYSADAVDREAERSGEDQVVRDVSEIESDDVRSAIETAIRDSTWTSDALPAGLEETVEEVDFFTGASDDDTYTRVGLSLYRFDPDEPPAIEFDATVADGLVESGNPGAVKFVLRNRSSETQEVFSGTVPPFGMLRAEADADDDRFLLWRDYEAEGCFNRMEGGWARCDIGKVTEVPGGESVARRYEILPEGTAHYPEDTVPPGPGTYRVTDSIGFSPGNGAPGTELSFTAEFTLEAVRIE